MHQENLTTNLKNQHKFVFAVICILAASVFFVIKYINTMNQESGNAEIEFSTKEAVPVTVAMEEEQTIVEVPQELTTVIPALFEGITESTTRFNTNIKPLDKAPSIIVVQSDRTSEATTAQTVTAVQQTTQTTTKASDTVATQGAVSTIIGS